MSKAANFICILFLLGSCPANGKVVNSDKNDVSSTLNETVSVLNIEDLNKTQYLNQNFRQGNYNYGYDVKPEGPNGQFHHENKATNGVVYGCYGYIDPRDKPQITYYVSDSWGYRPIQVGHSSKIFIPADHPEGSTEMKGVQRDWAQLEFPKQCINYEQEGLTSLGNTNTATRLSPPIAFQPPQGLIKAPPGIPISFVTTKRPDLLRGNSNNRGEIGYPGNFGKQGGPGILSAGGYGGEGGTGGLVSGSSEANGGPGGNGGDGGSASGSSTASGGNGGSGGHAGSASGSSVSNGGGGGDGGDGGEASGSSDSTGGHGGSGGKGGSSSGSSNASGGTAGGGGKGGVASGSSTALGGGGGDGGEGGNASGSSTAKGGSGGVGGRGGNASGSSFANGGTAGSGGRGGTASGSSSASAGVGGSAGNGGIASGSSSANGGSGGTGGSGAGATISETLQKGGYSYTPPNGFGPIKPAQPIQGSLQLLGTGGLLSEEQYTQEITNESSKLSSLGSRSPTSSRPDTTQTQRPTYPPTGSSQSPGTYKPNQLNENQKHNSGNNEEGIYQTQYLGETQPTIPPGYTFTRPTSIQTPRPTTSQSQKINQGQQVNQFLPTPGHVNQIRQQHPGSSSGEYFPTTTTQSQPMGLNTPSFQVPVYGDRFQTGNKFYPTKTPNYPSPGQVQVPSGGYELPQDSSESEERDQNNLGNGSGEQGNEGSSCQGYSSCANQPSPQEVDYAQIPGAISTNIPVIFYPDCRSNAFTRPAIVPFCPSVQQTPQPSCSHQQPLTMKFPTRGNIYTNVPASRGAYPSNFGNLYSTPQPRPAKRVVRRSRHNSQNRFA